MISRYLLILSLVAAAPHAAAVAPVSSVPQLQAAANRGDAQAMADLGWRYFRGEGVAEDNLQAMKWFRAAHDKGNPSGMLGLSFGLRYGSGVPRDVAAGEKLMIAAATLGDPYAQTTAGEVAEDSDEPAARAWYERAAAQDYPAGVRNLGYALLYGMGGPTDTTRALALLRRAAGMDDGRAMTMLGEAYAKGLGVTADPALARSWYGRGAAANDSRGHYNFGDVMARGVGGPVDMDEALRQYRLGAARGDRDSAYALAMAYSADHPERVDLAEMLRWLDRGTQLGDPRAMVWLGRVLQSGVLAPADQARGATLFARAAEDSELSGDYNLGRALEEGSGVPKDPVRAAALYRRSSADYPDALRRLVAMQFAGRGMAADPDAALATVDAELARGQLASMFKLAEFLVRGDQEGAADAVLARVLAHPGLPAALDKEAVLHEYIAVGSAWRDIGRFDRAEPLLLDLLAQQSRRPNVPPVVIASLLAEVGDMHYMRHAPQPAGVALARSLALATTIEDDNLHKASRLLVLAQRHMTGDAFAQAEHLRRQALALQESAPHALGDLLASTRVDLAQTLFDGGQYEQASTLLAQSMTQMEGFYHKHSLALAAGLDLQGQTWLALGRPDLAEAAYLRLLDLRARIGGDRGRRLHAVALARLAPLASRAKRHAEAEQIARQALALYAPLARKRDMGLARVQHTLGNVLRDARRHDEAQAELERALATIQQNPAGETWDTAAIMHDLGLNLRQLDRNEQAAAMLARAFEIRFARQPRHHLTRQSGDALAAVYRASANSQAADAVDQRLRAPAP